MRVVILTGLILLATPVVADELTEHHKICEAHRIGARIDKYVEGFEACAEVQKAWRSTEFGRAEAEQKAKDEADKAKINSFVKGGVK